MDWIKRNLIFVIGALVALVMLGLAGWYNYAGYSNNAAQKEKLNSAYEELKRLKGLKPAPGEGKVDNIKLAREQNQEAREFIRKLANRLEPIPSLPEGTNLLAKDYSLALQRSIDELQREATNSSVILPPGYKFSFAAQADRMTFSSGSLEPLAAQLGVVKVISGILNQAKINSLDGIRRERVSPDDSSGPATDYIDLHSTTNELAIIAPYEVSIRCFTPELAAVLAGFANSPYALIVEGVNVEPAATVVGEDSSLPGYPMPVTGYAPVAVPSSRYSEGNSAAAFQARYGRRATAPTPQPTPTPIPYPGAVAAPTRTGLQTFLTEKQLKVTLLIHVVKLLPTR
jgi:hypothetical protein